MGCGASQPEKTPKDSKQAKDANIKQRAVTESADAAPRAEQAIENGSLALPKADDASKGQKVKPRPTCIGWLF
ncbi:hypothetical protein CYMTET_21291 [Cymbomonas tetramitiformis]|uniref:Uncharacterized protein n=1 Tax=Cymbomonas tetramitiformis TaxID=36881 RepID=A0AAE0L3E4_9CHLO|nr:hypothetical protein CYMTET_21291 [Cymbomonas tetramitiformis]